MDNSSKNFKDMLKKTYFVIKKIVSFSALLVSFIVIIYLFQPIAHKYLNNDFAIGGDYFNGATYALHFSKHLPFPPQGWLNFWHQGLPIVGGYPVLSFYLMSPLFNIMSPEQAMELFAINTQLVFLLLSLLLFWEITLSLPISFILTVILLITRATYYQLFAEGLIVGATTQWFLPAALIPVFRYLKTGKINSLILSAIICGLALISHPAMGTLTVLLPSTIFLLISIFFNKTNLFYKIKRTALFFLFVFSIGSIGIYSLLIAVFQGAGSQPCDNLQCWGIYPEHFTLWFNRYTPLVVISLLSLAFIVKIISRRRISFKPVLISLICLCLFSLYLVLAYFHLINTIVATIFPRRTFWVINLLLLIVAAFSYHYITKVIGKKLSFILSIIVLSVVISIFYYQPQIIKYDASDILIHSNTFPDNPEKYFLSKYKEQELSKILPDWVINLAKEEKNYRFDSFDPMVTHWWNSVFSMPSTRGYSNFPTGENATWLYYLQKGTGENNKEDNPEIVKNRTLFLLDHFAIALYQNSEERIGYDRNLLKDREIFTNSETLKDLSFYEVSKKIISPIVSPTNASPLLIITDDNGYETIFRALSLTDLTSRKLITVKGPASINDLNSSLLEHFPILFLYRFKGNNWKVIEDYVTFGGKVIIDLGSLGSNILPKQLPEIFPMETVKTQEVDKWQLELTDNKITDIDLDQFSPPVYLNNPWKIYETTNDQIRPFAEVVLANNNNPTIISGNIGKGSLFVSGLNLPFHIVQFNNFEESKLFQQLLGDFTDKLAEAEVIRNTPESITVNGRGFTGIYFKENFNTGWKAQLSGQKLPVYKAGPAFMYIPIPDNNTDLEINIKYKGNLITWGLFSLSGIALIIGLLSLITTKPLKLSLRIIRNKLLFPFKKWVDGE